MRYTIGTPTNRTRVSSVYTMEEGNITGEALTSLFLSRKCSHVGVPPLFAPPIRGSAARRSRWARTLNLHCYEPPEVCAPDARQNKAYKTSVAVLVKQTRSCVFPWHVEEDDEDPRRDCLSVSVAGRHSHSQTQNTTFKLTHHTPKSAFLANKRCCGKDTGGKILSHFSETESSSESFRSAVAMATLTFGVPVPVLLCEKQHVTSATPSPIRSCWPGPLLGFPSSMRDQILGT